jgi:hypothetical protein
MDFAFEILLYRKLRTCEHFCQGAEMRLAARWCLAIVGMCIFEAAIEAQQKPAQGTSPSTSSTGVLPGLNYPTAILEQFTSPPIPPKGVKYVFLCYNIDPVPSPSAPFSLRAVSSLDAPNVSCGKVDASHPLKSGSKIVLVIDTNVIDLSRVQNLNVNITFTQGTTISQRAIRPSISGSVAFVALSQRDHIFYLLATDRLTGDAIPQLSVSLLYDPPAQGQPWTANTIYPPGSIVSGSGGHFYETQKGGMSGTDYPTDELSPVLVDDVPDNQCDWSPYGTTPPSGSGQGASAAPWLQNNLYSQNSVVYAPSQNMFYIETKTPAGAGGKCTSSSSYPFTSPAPTPQGEPNFPTTFDEGGGEMRWNYVQEGCPVGTPFWSADTDYPKNFKVCHSDNSVPRLYESAVAGHSGLSNPEMDSPTWPPTYTQDPGGEEWVYVSDGCTVGAGTPDWQAGFNYNLNAASPNPQICRPGAPNRLYELFHAGLSEANPPKFRFPASPIITEEPSTAVEWQYVSDGCIPTPASQWQALHNYAIDDTICQRGHVNRLYQVVTAGRSGGTLPYFENPDNQTARPQWTDIGIYPATVVTSAAVTEIQTNAISIPLAQVHALDYYNVDSGVLVSYIHIPSFSYSTPTTVNNGTPIQSGSTLLVDPVVTLTRYIWGFDAESKEHLADWRPGISLSFSLASPTSNFYFGGSSEVLRYVQVEYGFAVAEIPALTVGAFAAPSSSTPATHQVWAKGIYGGLSFNLSDFVKSLVKGGG